MDATPSPAGSVRRPGRNVSHPIPRRATKGPLDADDPLTATSDEAMPADDVAPIVVADAKASQPAAPSREPVALPQGLRFLLSPALYHEIPLDETPEPFFKSAHQPSPDETLPELLEHGHFRRAAEAALRGLLQHESNDALDILYLFHCRLACLTVVSRFDIAADEALPLLDYLTSNAPGVSAAIDLVPWPLRILLIRTQAVVAEDGGRRAIMALYNLASEARTHIRNARETSDNSMLDIWRARLQDIGIRVADVLVEVGETETALRHLDSLGSSNDEILTRKALLCVRAGDIKSAQAVCDKITSNQGRTILQALITVATTATKDAAKIWKNSLQAEDELRSHNEAVYLLYTGKIDEAISVLEQLTSGPIFHNLLYNLSTLYELCGDDAQSKKLSLIQQLAARPATSSATAWERPLLDFKL